MTDVLERFLRYVKIDTQSAYDSETYPSTPKQLDLLRFWNQSCAAWVWKK